MDETNVSYRDHKIFNKPLTFSSPRRNHLHRSRIQKLNAALRPFLSFSLSASLTLKPIPEYGIAYLFVCLFQRQITVLRFSGFLFAYDKLLVVRQPGRMRQGMSVSSSVRGRSTRTPSLARFFLLQAPADERRAREMRRKHVWRNGRDRSPEISKRRNNKGNSPQI